MKMSAKKLLGVGDRVVIIETVKGEKETGTVINVVRGACKYRKEDDKQTYEENNLVVKTDDGAVHYLLESEVSLV